MPRTGRKVKERDPKIVRLIFSLISPIWAAALLFFASNGSVSFFPLGLSNRINPAPLFVAFLVTLLLLAVAFVVLKIQNAAGKSLQQLQALSPDVFEDWVAARFRSLGYTVKTAGVTGDHGVDLLVERTGEIAVVQCKNYRSRSVGEPVLRDLFGAMHDFGADQAYLVTTGRLTDAAVRWAGGKPIHVWDGHYVARLSKEMARPSHAAANPELAPVDDKPTRGVLAATIPIATVNAHAAVCPKCGTALVERRNRTSGEPFLACPRYPTCRYTRPLPTE